MATKADDEAQILRLDSEWNEAYRRHDRAPLAHNLANDFAGLTTASDEAVTKASLTINRPGRARSVIFSEQSVHVFGDTGISEGRLQLELEDHRIDQRFLRVFAKRDGILAGGLRRGHARRRLAGWDAVARMRAVRIRTALTAPTDFLSRVTIDRFPH
jgi:ketosteroid isomerase-like protein